MDDEKCDPIKDFCWINPAVEKFYHDLTLFVLLLFFNFLERLKRWNLNLVVGGANIYQDPYP